MVDGHGTRLGRPPKGPISGKRATVATRITIETRRALDAEAERTGRSVSQVAEIWLDEARKGHAQYHQLIGGTAKFAVTIEKLAEIARAVDASVKDAKDAEIALRTAWEIAVAALLPTQLWSDAVERLRLSAEAWGACLDVLQAVEAAGEVDPVYVRATRPLYGLGGRLTAVQINARLADALRAPNAMTGANAEPGENATFALEELKKAGLTARKEIDEALDKVRNLLALEIIVRSRTREAIELGEAIAEAALGRPE